MNSIWPSLVMENFKDAAHLNDLKRRESEVAAISTAEMDEEFIKFVARDILKHRGVEDSAIWKGLVGIGMHLLMCGLKQRALDNIAAERLAIQERSVRRICSHSFLGQPGGWLGSKAM